jgi:ribonucleoside-diphosphate reductase alpha chain/ribonucleoside-triphosphate reductase
MSNNTVSTDDLRELPPIFWENYTERDAKGDSVSECFGLFNQYNARRYGRIIDGEDYRPDPRVIGMNPCGEITLEAYEACNLAEIFLPNIANEEEFAAAARLCYIFTKTISKYPFSDSRVNEVVSNNHRLGISVTGFLQAMHLKNETIFNNVYRSIEEFDETYSRQIGVKRSIKLTTVKPSGTLSLLPGVTPGVHPAFAKHYIRRIRFASDDPLVAMCESHGFPAEPAINYDGSKDWTTMVVSFVDKSPALTAHEISAVKQLEYQKWLQTYWADNSVSCTVYFKDEELPAIRHWLGKNYNENMKSTSMLRHTGHGFVQAPYEEITQDTYESIKAVTKPITRIIDTKLRDLNMVECAGGACPIK